MNLYAILDKKVSEYDMFFTEQNEVNAVRHFAVACESEKTRVGQFTQDFDLYKVATIDTITGDVESVTPPKLIIMGTAAKIYRKKEMENNGL